MIIKSYPVYLLASFALGFSIVFMDLTQCSLILKLANMAIGKNEFKLNGNLAECCRNKLV